MTFGVMNTLIDIGGDKKNFGNTLLSKQIYGYATELLGISFERVFYHWMTLYQFTGLAVIGVIGVS